jgi:hypothetical protein
VTPHISTFRPSECGRYICELIHDHNNRVRLLSIDEAHAMQAEAYRKWVELTGIRDHAPATRFMQRASELKKAITDVVLRGARAA